MEPLASSQTCIYLMAGGKGQVAYTEQNPISADELPVWTCVGRTWKQETTSSLSVNSTTTYDGDKKAYGNAKEGSQIDEKGNNSTSWQNKAKKDIALACTDQSNLWSHSYIKKNIISKTQT